MGDPIEDTTHAVLLGDMDAKTGLDRVTVAAAAQRLIFCPYTQLLLDVRSTVVLEEIGTERAVTALHARGWDAIEPEVPVEEVDGVKVYDLSGFRVRVVDGRKIYAE